MLYSPVMINWRFLYVICFLKTELWPQVLSSLLLFAFKPITHVHDFHKIGMLRDWDIGRMEREIQVLVVMENHTVSADFGDDRFLFPTEFSDLFVDYFQLLRRTAAFHWGEPLLTHDKRTKSFGIFIGIDAVVHIYFPLSWSTWSWLFHNYIACLRPKSTVFEKKQNFDHFLPI